MGEQLRPTALVVALEAIQNRVMENRKRGKYTWVFLDEVYLYLKYKYTSSRKNHVYLPRLRFSMTRF